VEVRLKGRDLEHPARLAATQKSVSELQVEIDALWAKHEGLKASGLPATSTQCLERIVDRVVVREVMLRERRKQERAERERAPATVESSSALNERGYLQPCVYAVCQREDYEVGPVWGTSERSVMRALCTLTRECPCGARRHELQGR
jgi:hypothetical protein